MSIPSGIVVYVVLWWVVFFAVLPWGVRSQEESGEVVPGTEPGAPVKPSLGRKALITTGIAALLWLAVYAVIESGVIDLRP